MFRQIDAVASNLQILTRSSGAVVPESWASLRMGYGKDDNLQVVCPKNDVERKSTKNRSAQVSIENLKSVGRIGDKTNHTRSNSSRNRTAARTLRSAYHAAASSASSCAAGWKLTDLRISRSICCGVDDEPRPKRWFEQHPNRGPEVAARSRFSRPLRRFHRPPSQGCL